MFLSVIVSCYNCRETIKRVLNSLVVQSFSDFEVIISDDKSTDDFMKVVDKYKSLLDIKYFQTTCSVHCPSNTRRGGLSHANGEWVTFIDHDDAFTPNAFQAFIDTYNSTEEKLPFFYSPVNHVTKDGASQILEAQTWLHGNFYNRQWLIDNGINFKENLLGNEDLYFNTQVYDILKATNTNFWTCTTPIYNWYVEQNSLSNTIVDGADYTEYYFADYLTACIEPRIDIAKKYPGILASLRQESASVFLYAYFYYERAVFKYKDAPVLKSMLQATKQAMQEFFGFFYGDVEELYATFSSDVNRYNEQRQIVSNCSGPFVETHSLKEFFNLVWQQ